MLFDPDWNPASDKQAAGRIVSLTISFCNSNMKQWREGQKRRCYVYRFMSTCTIEEKIIQRQLSKEGLQNIVEDKEQVNRFSTDELKALFSRRTDSRSDTHDTLRCKRCSSVKTLSTSPPASSLTFTSKHKDECSAFLEKLKDCIRLEAAERSQSESIQPYINDLDSVHNQLLSDHFSNLPQFSREIREIVSGADRELEELKILAPFSILSKFVYLWGELVPRLSALASNSSDPDRNDTEHIGDEDEWVPQEGCPEEEDFNRWSHHCGAATTDDECLRRATEGDSSVSFVFGLEINWDLLQNRQEAQRDSEHARKAQMKEAIAALNQRRRSSVSNPLETISCNDSSSPKNPPELVDCDASPKLNPHSAVADSTAPDRSTGVKGKITLKQPKRKVPLIDDCQASDAPAVRKRKAVIVIDDSDSESETKASVPKCSTQNGSKDASPMRSRQIANVAYEKENVLVSDSQGCRDWACSVCTYLNSTSARKECSICGYR